MSTKKQSNILNIILLFILLQPFLDILSRLSILNIIPNISTYLKPLFVFGLSAYMLFMYSPIKKKWGTYIIFFSMFLIGHFYILYRLLVSTSTILHEFRFVLNIIYMIALFIIMSTLYYHFEDKEYFLYKLKKTILITMLTYGLLLIMAVLTGTSGMTYEYADKNKLGYKGWFDSGQIFGHALSVMFPILIYTVLRPTQKKYIKIIFLSVILITVSLLGTKVPYYIVMIVLVLYLIISLFIKIFNKEFKRNYFNIIIVLISIIVLIFTYKYTPVYYNTELNRKNANTNLDSYDIDNIDGSKNIKSIEDLINEHSGSEVDKLIEYNQWNTQASDYLVELYEKGVVHPSNMRKKQFLYNYKKYSLSTIEYKIFGIGYLNQEDGLSIESDFWMALFCFGILGFLLFLLLPIVEFVKTTVFILKNLKKVDLEAYLLYMGLGIFFCISIYAGYTYIYTNFSIFLVMLIIMLKTKMDLIKNNIKSEKKVKSIDFLLLHLGYGGIETATINSANALCKKYTIRIISFYKLDRNQTNKLNDNIKVIYLYNGSPNREEFKKQFYNHNVIGILKEGLKACSILIKKKILVIKYLRETNSDAIVSTRVEFSVLLSRYGRFNTLKIAQEHHYHNNDRKYIKKLKTKYNRIDYLCALTTTLEKDYKKFLRNNNYTKIVLLPNMLVEIPKEKSSLKNNNIVTVSRLDLGKKNDDIIKAFSKVQDKESKLYIIGDGNEYNNLVSLIKELNLENRIIMTGYLNHQEIERYLLDSSLFLMASVTEGLPMVLLEAMSYGIPCIAYETASGVNDVIDNDINGYIVKNRNEKEYIERINLIISDDNKRRKMGKEAQKKANTFYKNEILKIWNKILK